MTKSKLLASLDAFTRGYIECALWSSNDESNEQGGDPLDRNYDASDLALTALRGMIRDCAAFCKANDVDLSNAIGVPGYTSAHAGHDFWLTRNHHGAGFWDGDLPQDLGDRLTKGAQAYREINLYVYRGRIYA